MLARALANSLSSIQAGIEHHMITEVQHTSRAVWIGTRYYWLFIYSIWEKKIHRLVSSEEDDVRCYINNLLTEIYLGWWSIDPPNRMQRLQKLLDTGLFLHRWQWGHRAGHYIGQIVSVSMRAQTSGNCLTITFLAVCSALHYDCNYRHFLVALILITRHACHVGTEYRVEKGQVPLIKVESADHLIFHVVIHLGARDCRATLLFVIVLGWTLHPAYQANSRGFFCDRDKLIL